MVASAPRSNTQLYGSENSDAFGCSCCAAALGDQATEDFPNRNGTNAPPFLIECDEWGHGNKRRNEIWGVTSNQVVDCVFNGDQEIRGKMVN